MLADLAGPYQPGDDAEIRKGRHILLVVYSFPKWKREAAPKDEPIPDPEEFEADGGGDPTQEAEVASEEFDPFELEVEGTGIPAEPTATALNALKKDEDRLKIPYTVVNVSFVEILPNKSAATAAAALSRAYARLRACTDQGGEMVNKTIRTWSEARLELRSPNHQPLMGGQRDS